jgi:hypothetical protein
VTHLETDVLVVGAGGAGMYAAVRKLSTSSNAGGRGKKTIHLGLKIPPNREIGAFDLRLLAGQKIPDQTG